MDSNTFTVTQSANPCLTALTAKTPAKNVQEFQRNTPSVVAANPSDFVLNTETNACPISKCELLNADPKFVTMDPKTWVTKMKVDHNVDGGYTAFDIQFRCTNAYSD